MLPREFSQALPVLLELEANGYEAYFVGGSVRDHLIGRPINDVDIATSALPEEVKSIFKDTVDIGIDHGTVLVLTGSGRFEVTTFRTETGYQDFRRPDSVDFVRSLEEDLQRRDFTINSMAMDARGRIKDPFGGRGDLRDKKIRTVGIPDERFSEDALRMMRGIRFVAQLGFHMEDETREAIVRHSSLMSHIAVERKTMEFEKILASVNKHLAFDLLIRTRLYRELPMLNNYGNVMEAMRENPAVRSLSKDQSWLFLLFHVMDGGFLKSWRLPKKEIKAREKERESLKKRLEGDWSPLLLYKTGRNGVVNVESVASCISGSPRSEVLDRYDELPIHSVKDIEATGSELIKWKGKPGGPWVKEEIAKIEAAILNGELPNEKASIKKWVKTCNRS